MHILHADFSEKLGLDFGRGSDLTPISTWNMGEPRAFLAQFPSGNGQANSTPEEILGKPTHPEPKKLQNILCLAPKKLRNIGSQKIDPLKTRFLNDSREAFEKF